MFIRKLFAQAPTLLVKKAPPTRYSVFGTIRAIALVFVRAIAATCGRKRKTRRDGPGNSGAEPSRRGSDRGDGMEARYGYDRCVGVRGRHGR